MTVWTLLFVVVSAVALSWPFVFDAGEEVEPASDAPEGGAGRRGRGDSPEFTSGEGDG